jgi:hypothetical protein
MPAASTAGPPPRTTFRSYRALSDAQACRFVCSYCYALSPSIKKAHTSHMYWNGLRQPAASSTIPFPERVISRHDAASSQCPLCPRELPRRSVDAAMGQKASMERTLTWIEIHSLTVELIFLVRQMESWMNLRVARPGRAVFGSDLATEHRSRQAARFRKHTGRCLDRRFQSPCGPLHSQSCASPLAQVTQLKISETGATCRLKRPQYKNSVRKAHCRRVYESTP